MAEKLSVLIPCKNERHNIRSCVESVCAFADEVIVADSGSTDGTLDIIRQMPQCRLIEREYVNPADFKNWAMPHCSHRWVLAIDADERVTAELAEEIRQVLSEPAACDGYWIYRRNHFFGHEIKHCGWQRDKILGLYRKSVCHYSPGYVHEHLVVETKKIGSLHGKYLHYPYWSFDQYLEKLGRYTTWAAQEMFDKGKRASGLSMMFRPAYSFFRHYVLRRGFLDGRKGLIISLLASYYVFLKFAKLWAMRQGLTQPLEPSDQTTPGSDTVVYQQVA